MITTSNRRYFTDTGIEVPAVTAEQMREVDHIAGEETGPNLFQMMENAGRNLALLAMAVLGDTWTVRASSCWPGVEATGEEESVPPVIWPIVALTSDSASPSLTVLKKFRHFSEQSSGPHRAEKSIRPP